MRHRGDGAACVAGLSSPRVMGWPAPVNETFFRKNKVFETIALAPFDTGEDRPVHSGTDRDRPLSAGISAVGSFVLSNHAARRWRPPAAGEGRRCRSRLRRNVLLGSAGKKRCRSFDGRMSRGNTFGRLAVGKKTLPTVRKFPAIACAAQGPTQDRPTQGPTQDRTRERAPERPMDRAAAAPSPEDPHTLEGRLLP